jgi:hypothetical protein
MKKYILLLFLFSVLILGSCAVDEVQDVSQEYQKEEMKQEVHEPSAPIEPPNEQMIQENKPPQEMNQPNNNEQMPNDMEQDMQDNMGEGGEGPPFEVFTNEEGDYTFTCNTKKPFARIGNQYHLIYSATSDDGISWQEEQYIMSGSVPEVISFNDKYYLFVMGSCLMYQSDDGLTFEPYKYTLLNKNLDLAYGTFGGVDPSAIIDNNLIRLYFYEPKHDGQPGDPTFLEGDHLFAQYTSEDAITWTRVGEAYAIEGGTDPDVVEYNDQFFMFISSGTNVKGTVSQDAVTFNALSNEEPVHYEGGVPDSLVINNKIHMYAHKGTEQGTYIRLLTSTDGKSWALGDDIIEGESPSVVQLEDGTYRMYYVKRVNEKQYQELSN